ncbi:MAG TPA: hypothetical protein DCM62_05070 [Bacteroidales bacterium]|nr:hypothetical protein [Bacteroidales bacterium]
MKSKQKGFIIIVGLMLLHSSVISGQGRVLTRANAFERGNLRGDNYLKIPELIVYEGTWRWMSAAGDSIFTLEFMRYKFVPQAELKPYMFSYDAITGNYSLIVNGRTASSNFNKRTDPHFPSFKGTDMDDDGLKVLSVGFHDFVKDKFALGSFELLNENLNKARWSMRNIKRIVITPGEVWHKEFSLPNHIVLHRVSREP